MSYMNFHIPWVLGITIAMVGVYEYSLNQSIAVVIIILAWLISLALLIIRRKKIDRKNDAEYMKNIDLINNGEEDG